MRGLLDAEDDREDVVRHGTQGAIVADQVQMTILEVGIELSVIGCFHALSALRKRNSVRACVASLSTVSFERTRSSLKSFDLSMVTWICTEAPARSFVPDLNIGRIALSR